MSARPYHSHRTPRTPTHKYRSIPSHTKSNITPTSKRTHITRYTSKEHSQSQTPKTQPRRTHTKSSNNKRSKYGKTSAQRRKQRDINYQYKLYSLREIIQKITTKSSIISTNTAKETLITYYQTFTTSHELLDELEHRFFSVLRTEEEDKSLHPYISDTETVSESRFKFGNANTSTAMDESKAYCIQVRVINLLTFWMKEYFMEDFDEVNMLQQLKNFIHKIKSLRQKQRLPSIPTQVSNIAPMIHSNNTSDIPPIPDVNTLDNDMYKQLICDNKRRDVLVRLGTNDGISPVSNGVRPTKNATAIQSYHCNGQSHKQKEKYKRRGFTVSENPLHCSNVTNAEHSPHSQNSNTMKTDVMEQIGNRIQPIHAENEEKTPPKQLWLHTGKANGIIRVNKDLTVYLSREDLFYLNGFAFDMTKADLYYIINGVDNIKVMVRNTSDYASMHNRIGMSDVTIDSETEHEKEEKAMELPKVFKRHKNMKSEDSDTKIDNNGREVTENMTPITSSTEPRENSVTSFIKMEESTTMQSNLYGIDDSPVNNIKDRSDNIVRRYYVSDPNKYYHLSDKIEKTLNQQKRRAPRDMSHITRDMSQRCLRDQSDKNGIRKHRQTPVIGGAQLGCSVRGANKLRHMFEEEIRPLKEDFQSQVKNKVISEQITLMTFNAFKRVRKREFIDQAWKCKDRLELAGNLCQLIDHFNCISRWVQITILHAKDVKKRGRMIKKFIKIMDLLLALNNFQSLCAVYGAITSSSIYSLDNAWEYVPSKHKERFENIKHYFVTANNMSNLRTLHKERNPPMIPYTGIYLQDLIQTEERFKERMIREQMKNNNVNQQNGNGYIFTGSGGVVFDHLTKMSKQIDNILIYAKTPYSHIKNDQITQKYVLSEFADQAKYSDEQIYKLSENVAKGDAQR